jgi:hypothetical protein
VVPLHVPFPLLLLNRRSHMPDKWELSFFYFICCRQSARCHSYSTSTNIPFPSVYFTIQFSFKIGTFSCVILFAVMVTVQGFYFKG